MRGISRAGGRRGARQPWVRQRGPGGRWLPGGGSPWPARRAAEGGRAPSGGARNLGHPSSTRRLHGVSRIAVDARHRHPRAGLFFIRRGHRPAAPRPEPGVEHPRGALPGATPAPRAAPSRSEAAGPAPVCGVSPPPGPHTGKPRLGMPGRGAEGMGTVPVPWRVPRGQPERG